MPVEVVPVQPARRNSVDSGRTAVVKEPDEARYSAAIAVQVETATGADLAAARMDAAAELDTRLALGDTAGLVDSGPPVDRQAGRKWAARSEVAESQNSVDRLGTVEPAWQLVASAADDADRAASSDDFLRGNHFSATRFGRMSSDYSTNSR